MSVYGSLIHNCQNLETIKMRSVGDSVRHAMEYESTLKRNELSSHERHGGTLNAHDYMKKANLKRYILYDSNYLTFWKRQN